jgi:hypothetical protein
MEMEKEMIKQHSTCITPYQKHFSNYTFVLVGAI